MKKYAFLLFALLTLFLSGCSTKYKESDFIGKTSAEIEAVGGLVDAESTYSGTLTRGKTVFVKFSTNRTTGQVTSAQVYSETGTSPIETYFTSGKNAYYVVLRQYFREPSLNVIYVNIDE